MKKMAKKFVNFVTPSTSRDARSSSSSNQGGRVAYEEFTFDLPRHAEVKHAKWPSEDFVRDTGIKDDFDSFIRKASLENFMGLRPYCISEFVKSFHATHCLSS